LQQYPDQQLDNITFPEPLVVHLKMPVKEWSNDDKKIDRLIKHLSKRQE